MEFREVLETTGTCRFYRPDPIPDDVLRRVLDGTRWAPTGGNRQGVRFVVVCDSAKRRQLRDWYVPLWEQYASRASTRYRRSSSSVRSSPICSRPTAISTA